MVEEGKKRMEGEARTVLVWCLTRIVIYESVSKDFDPQGRLKIAQRFIAGTRDKAVRFRPVGTIEVFPITFNRPYGT